MCGTFFPIRAFGIACKVKDAGFMHLRITQIKPGSLMRPGILSAFMALIFAAGDNRLKSCGQDHEADVIAEAIE